MLTRYDTVPNGFLEARASQLLSVLPGPSLINLPGKKPEPVFVSVLLHGNEDVGLHAVQNLLKFYRHETLPRAVSIFVGNLTAAKLNLRRLDDQPDYNRVWPGHEMEVCPESDMMAQVTEEMRRRRCFLSLDFHNNTGLNPYYALVNSLDPGLIHLAIMFSRTIVYTLRPNGTQAMAFKSFCPALTLECGKVGDHHGYRQASAFLQAAVELNDITPAPVRPRDYDLFHSTVQVKMPAQYQFSVGYEEGAHIRLRDDLDTLNFQELAPGTEFAEMDDDPDIHLAVRNEHGERVENDYFQRLENKLLIKKPVIPAMLTLNKHIIRQDCLCYLMERIQPLSGLS